VQDRTIYEDSVFARMLNKSGMIDDRDYRTYISLVCRYCCRLTFQFANMSNFMKKPNLIVHLDVTPEESLERIKRRSRNCESGVPIEYLRALYQEYEIFIDDISRVIPVIKVNWNEFRTAEEMARMIRAEFEKMRNIVHIDFEQTYQ